MVEKRRSSSPRRQGTDDGIFLPRMGRVAVGLAPEGWQSFTVLLSVETAATLSISTTGVLPDGIGHFYEGIKLFLDSVLLL